MRSGDYTCPNCGHTHPDVRCPQCGEPRPPVPNPETQSGFIILPQELGDGQNRTYVELGTDDLQPILDGIERWAVESAEPGDSVEIRFMDRLPATAGLVFPAATVERTSPWANAEASPLRGGS